MHHRPHPSLSVRLSACRVLDGPVEELRVLALDTIAALAVAFGPDFALFAPTVRKVRNSGQSHGDAAAALAVAA